MSNDGFAIAAATVKSSDGKPSCFCTMCDGNWMPPKSLYALYCISTSMSPTIDWLIHVRTRSTWFCALMMPSILYLSSIVNDTSAPSFVSAAVALLAIAAFTKPCGVDQSISLHKSLLSGAGPAGLVPPTSGSEQHVAGGAPDGGVAATGTFHAYSPLMAVT